MLLIVLLAWLAVPALAAEDWKHAATANFELFFNGNEEEARSTIEYFEQVRDVFLRATSGQSTTPVPVTIIAFKNHRQFKPYSPNSAVGAFYAGTENRDYIALADTGPEYYPVAVHEYMHLLIRHMGLKIPLWMNEGIAEVYSTLKPHGGKLLVGSVPRGRSAELLYDKWLPLRRILAVDLKSREYNEKKRASMFYSQSWALVHMMMLHPVWREGFPKFVSAVGSGLTAEQGFQKTWGVTLDDVEKRLRSYVDSEALTAALIDMKLAKFSAPEIRPAEPDRVEIVLATLMGLVGKTAEGTKRLNDLAARTPEDYRVHEALGLLGLRARDHESARRHLGRATELGSPHWTTWWDYARLLYLDRTTERANIVRVLSKTLALNESHFDARLMLAEEFNRAGQPSEALSTLREMKQVKASEAWRVFLVTAFAQAQLKNFVEAQKALEEARSYAKDPRQRSGVEDFARYLTARSQTRERTGRDEQSLSVSGVFQELDCSVQPRTFVVATDAGVLRLAISDASSIIVKGVNRGRRLNCGAQSEKRKVKVEYLPATGLDVAGTLRAITFE